MGAKMSCVSKIGLYAVRLQRFRKKRWVIVVRVVVRVLLGFGNIGSRLLL